MRTRYLTSEKNDRLIKSMRTFIAIELPAEIKDYLSQLQGELKTCGADVKWVEPKNIHLTLKFLGEVGDEKLDKITQIIQDVASEKNRFPLCICSLGAFPRIESPRVIWVGVDSGDKETEQIAKELEEKISGIGIPKEDRVFSCHITIGRIRTPHNREKLVRILKDKTGSGGKNLEFEVNKITLFKSTLTPKGPLYEALKEAILKTT
ncbi:MAG: RNA 2',3'-cyclic phosphodiesterase [Candidatus Omnitrophica bacterium]|nr:RNA 2',3'-cyclic phosphodiesterase [Candidatus Omnitrophota bacterium]MDD5592333.1 RNA 2',3'-cyclic phosphodiesterase [Candidatus Omnitrophota bacterium]